MLIISLLINQLSNPIGVFMKILQNESAQRAYSYYTDALTNLETKKSTISTIYDEAAHLESPIKVPVSSTSKTPLKAPSNHSYRNTMLIVGVAAITAAALAALLSNPSEETFIDQAKGLGQNFLDAISSQYEAMSSHFFSWLNTPSGAPTTLENIPLTEADQAALAIRDNYPDQYFTTPIAQFFGNGTSAIYKTIRLAAGLGEIPKPLSPLCSLTTAGAGWCSTVVLGSQKTIEQNIIRTPISYEKYADSVTGGGMFEKPEAKIRADYAAYKRHIFEANKEAQDVLDQAPDAIKKAHFSEFAQADKHTQNKLQYHTVTPGHKFPDEMTGGFSIERSERRADSGALHETRAQWGINIRGENLDVQRYVRDTHDVGARNSAWDQFFLQCEKKSHTQFSCSTLSGFKQLNLDHVEGNLKYSINEKVMAPGCSIVTETLKFPHRVVNQTYALDPSKQKPYILPRLVDSVRFLKDKAATWRGGADAKIITPTVFPEGLPQTCEELHA